MEGATSIKLELDEIQSGVLRPRPAPYVAIYVALRIDDVNYCFMPGLKALRWLAELEI